MSKREKRQGAVEMFVSMIPRETIHAQKRKQLWLVQMKRKSPLRQWQMIRETRKTEAPAALTWQTKRRLIGKINADVLRYN